MRAHVSPSIAEVTPIPHDHEPQPEEPDRSRRSFLGALLGVASASVGALLAVPVFRYIHYPVSADAGAAGWTEVGSVASIAESPTPVRRTLTVVERDGWREIGSQPVIYLINTGGNITVLSAICPHLGCTLPWDPERKEFVCPCHRGTFSATGAYVSGPPRRSMDSLETKQANGKLRVTYQYFRPDVAAKQVTG